VGFGLVSFFKVECLLAIQEVMKAEIQGTETKINPSNGQMKTRVNTVQAETGASETHSIMPRKSAVDFFPWCRISSQRTHHCTHFLLVYVQSGAIMLNLLRRHYNLLIRVRSI
jgi:hypothetical protein